MGKFHSMDFRERIFGHIAAGHSCRAAARVFGVRASMAIRLASDHRDRGESTPKRQGRAPGRAGKLAPHMAFLTGIVRTEPDITLKERAGALEETHGPSVQLSTIHRALIRAGFSYKKRPGRSGAYAG